MLATVGRVGWLSDNEKDTKTITTHIYLGKYIQQTLLCSVFVSLG